MMRESKGNMYGFVNFTWNICKGVCPHGCTYCFMRQFKQNPLRFDEKELKTDLGAGNFIFVGSSCDMWADAVDGDWIKKILNHCAKYPKNKYLFQTKNPKRFDKFKDLIPKESVLGTTIETNRRYPQMGQAPDVKDRAFFIGQLSKDFETCITLEPIMDFDLDDFVRLIREAGPDWVNIGADSKNHNLPEPSKEKILALVEKLKGFTEIKKKSNLGRLLK